MRLILLPTILLGLTACERYTDATSPCFGSEGEPLVSRAAGVPLPLEGEPVADDDCVFEAIN